MATDSKQPKTPPQRKQSTKPVSGNSNPQSKSTAKQTQSKPQNTAKTSPKKKPVNPNSQSKTGSNPNPAKPKTASAKKPAVNKNVTTSKATSKVSDKSGMNKNSTKAAGKATPTKKKPTVNKNAQTSKAGSTASGKSAVKNKKPVTNKKVAASKPGSTVNGKSSATKQKPTTGQNPKQQAKKSKTANKPGSKIQPVKRKSTGRKLSNLEVRNSQTTKRRKVKKIKFVKPKSRVNEPHIYDEAKYLKSLKKTGKKNLMYITGGFAILFIISLLFVVKLELTHSKNGNDLDEYAKSKYTKATSVESKRGTIFDTNGEALAINLEVYTLRAVTDDKFECNVDNKFENCALKDTGEAAKGIAKALKLDSEGQAYIKERLDYGIKNDKYEVTFGSTGKNITLSQKKALEKLNYPWLQFDAQELRFYPYGDFASYVVGYSTKNDKDGEIKGALGVEKALDGHLKGQDGVQTSLFDHYGIKLTDAQQSSIPEIDGTDVYLTLDSVVQTYLENAMEKALTAKDVKDINYDGLFTIVMDANTGDILAAQSYPSFDPNLRKIENYTNYFTNYCFEPGSTFKAATIAAADEAGVWNNNVTEPTGERSAASWGGYKIKDWNEGKGWGNLTWNQGFYLSANTVMTYIMDKIPNQFWLDFVSDKLMIGKPVETQFFETPSCIFNPSYDIEYATSSFGQGITVNVLQMLRMYSALLKDGNMVTPHIVQSIKDQDTGEEIYTDDSLEVIKNVVSKKTSAHIREALRGVVTYQGPNQWQTSDDGTGAKYKGADYAIGMKTGTAQMVGDNGSYLKDDYIYSAIATAPIKDPQLIIYTAVIAPQGSTNISYKAFPQYIKETLDNSLSYLNSENRAVDIEDKVDTYKVGNYVGKDMSEVKGKTITKIGTGKVTSQYPKSGQQISKTQKVIVFGTDKLAFPDIVGYSYNETVAVCNTLETTCSFSNTGTKVKSVKNDGKKKYKIKME